MNTNDYQLEDRMTRIVKYDILRIIASFSIVLLHVSASYWSVVDLHGKEFLVMTIYNSMTRFAVPVFFMLSGLFLVSPRRENPMAGKRILKLVMLFYVWSAFYAFQRIVVDTLKGDFSMEVWRAALERFIFGHVHMWFLQILCGFYLRWALFLSWQDTWDMGYLTWEGCFLIILSMCTFSCLYRDIFIKMRRKRISEAAYGRNAGCCCFLIFYGIFFMGF